MHPLAAPGALWVLSRAGKVPRPPAGGRNLSQEIDFLWKARERAFTFFFCFSGAFASAEATKGLSGRPLETFGAHPVEADGDHKKIDLLRKARERAFTFFFCFSGAFASAEATKGLSGRPLETFGAHPVEADGDHKKIDLLRKARERAFTFFSVSQELSPLRRRPKGFPVALWKPSGPTLLKRMGIAKNGSLAEGKGKSLSCFFLYHSVSCLCGGDQGAFRSPPGPLRGPYLLRRMGTTKT